MKLSKKQYKKPILKNHGNLKSKTNAAWNGKDSDGPKVFSDS